MVQLSTQLNLSKTFFQHQGQMHDPNRACFQTSAMEPTNAGRMLDDEAGPNADGSAITYLEVVREPVSRYDHGTPGMADSTSGLRHVVPNSCPNYEVVTHAAGSVSTRIIVFVITVFLVSTFSTLIYHLIMLDPFKSKPSL